MYKVLLLGKLDRTAEELYRCLCRHYYVQFCTETSETLQNMMRITRPNMVMVNAADQEAIPVKVFEFLDIYFHNTPVVVIGSKEVCDLYQDYYDRDNVVPLYRPITTSGVMEQCAKFFTDVKYDDINNMKTDDEEQKHILVVDDSAVTLRSVKALLDRKYRISVATSGEMAIKTMQKSLPDLVLLDYEMPDCDGKQTLEMIRNDDMLKDVPVMFLTGVADKQHIASVLELNPVGYLLKPPEQEKLFAAIELVLGVENNNFYGGI